MFPLIYVLIFCQIFFLLIHVEYRRYRLNKRFAHIPGPRQFPIIGNLFAINTNRISDIKMIADEVATQPIIRLVLFNQMFLIVSDPHVLGQILASNSFSDRVPFLRNFWRWNESLIMSGYPIWRVLRKTVRSSFNLSRVVTILPTMVKHVERYESIIGKHADTGVPFDFLDVAINVTLGLALETMFNCTQKNMVHLHDLYELIAQEVANRNIKPYYYSNWVYKFSSCYKNIVKVYDTFEKQLQPIISDLVNDFANSNGSGKSTSELLLMAKSEGKITEKQFKDTVTFLLHNNYDTTSVAVSYLILMIAMHPEVDKKLIEELNQHYQKGDPIDIELLKKLTYMEMVIKETIRLFPIPISNRRNISDVHIDGIGNLPKGTIILPVFYKLHRWQHIWGPDAEKFNPDNFLPENVAKRHPSSFMGFSAGPRMCIGYEHAKASLKLALIHILTNFRFETEMKIEDLSYVPPITLKCKEGYFVRAYRR